MTFNKVNPPCYIPLSLVSQAGSEHVLYYNANAAPEEIFNCASRRMHALMNLFECLGDYHNAPSKDMTSLMAVSSYLLSDV